MSLMSDEKVEYSPVDSSEDGLLDDERPRPHRDAVWRRRFYILLAFSISVLLLVTLAFAYKIASSNCVLTPGANAPYSPAPLKFVNRYLTSDPDTPKFMGEPRPELDEAWHKLLEATMIKFSDEELLLSNNATSVRHKDGGYVGGLGISHSLHCLKRMKQYLHPDYYYDHEDQDWAELYSHVDHCLESLRQSVMCSADINVYTLKWTPHSRYKPTVKVPQPHACVDWSALHGWMKERAASLDDMVGPPESLYEGHDHSGR